MLISKKLVKIQSVIDRLEKRGFVVRLKHLTSNRPYAVQYTAFAIEHPVTGLCVHAAARCAPGDTFNKAEGTQIAFSRAMRALSDYLGTGVLRRILN